METFFTRDLVNFFFFHSGQSVLATSFLRSKCLYEEFYKLKRLIKSIP